MTDIYHHTHEQMVSQEEIDRLKEEIKQLRTAVEQSLPQLEHVLPKIQNRHARKAVDRLYTIIGQKPPHQIKREQRRYRSVHIG